MRPEDSGLAGYRTPTDLLQAMRLEFFLKSRKVPDIERIGAGLKEGRWQGCREFTLKELFTT
jgi:hypothetical protein